GPPLRHVRRPVLRFSCHRCRPVVRPQGLRCADTRREFRRERATRTPYRRRHGLSGPPSLPFSTLSARDLRGARPAPGRRRRFDQPRAGLDLLRGGRGSVFSGRTPARVRPGTRLPPVRPSPHRPRPKISRMDDVGRTGRLRFRLPLRCKRRSTRPHPRPHCAQRCDPPALETLKEELEEGRWPL
ncbi:MAG: hypothetical protein AVDCRST_MAG58-1562, partial [uncultured Rubrobacteraceae bacterium]